MRHTWRVSFSWHYPWALEFQEEWKPQSLTHSEAVRLSPCGPPLVTAVWLAFLFRQSLREQWLWSWWCPLCPLPLWTSLYPIHRQILFGLWSFSHAQYVWPLRPQKSLLSTCHKNFLPRVYIWKIPDFNSCVSPPPPWALFSTEHSIPSKRVLSELHRNSLTHYFHPI